MLRTTERQISEKDVEDVVRSGAILHTNERGTHGGMKRLYKKFVADRVVVVVAEVRQKDCWVITTYAEED